MTIILVVCATVSTPDCIEIVGNKFEQRTRRGEIIFLFN